MPIGFPFATVGVGGWSKDGWQPNGATIIDESFTVGQKASAPGFEVRRLDDTDDHKQFFVRLL